MGKDVLEKDVQQYQIFSIMRGIIRERDHSLNRRRWHSAMAKVFAACYVARSMIQRYLDCFFGG